jgi:hypothetical protein
MTASTKGTLTPQLALIFVPRIPWAKEHTMISQFRPACLALALVATAGPACAQTWIYEPDDVARVYRPRAVYQEQYVPRVYNSYAYEPVVTAPPVAVAPIPRTVINRTVVNRTVIPQGRGRGPIVKERIVTETAAPLVRPRVVTRPAVVDYTYAPAVTEAYALAPAPAPRAVTRPVVVDYGPRVTDSYAFAPIAQPVVTTVPAVRPYRYINNRLLVVDPVTGAVVGEIND